MYKLSEAVFGLRDYGVYTYYEELDVIFISISKNANTTINRMFFDKLGLPYDPDDYHSIHRYKSKHLNLTQKEFLEMDTIDTFVFAFSRNPLTRLISCYNNKICNEHYWNIHENYFGYFFPSMPFEKFARRVCKIPDWYADGHFLSQTNSIFPKNVNKLDYLGKVESFSEDISLIINKFDLPKYKCTNRSRKSDYNLQRYYTKEIIEDVYDRYKQDFKKLDYQNEYEKATENL